MEKNKEKRKERKEGKNTFERSRTTGGRKEGASERRWLCLALAVAVNRGFGNNWDLHSLIATRPLQDNTHQSESAIPFAFHGQSALTLTKSTAFYHHLPCPFRAASPPFLVSPLLPLI